MNPLRIAILGATSHIAKGLIACWIERHDRELLLYARSPEHVQEFIGQLGRSTETKVLPIKEYGREQHDVVVNCVGFGNPQRLKDNLADIFTIASKFDDLILAYLAENHQTIYVNLSSGAAYGADFSQPVNEQSQARFNINDLKPEEFYGVAKLHSEARHRALKALSIIDLRIFGYFSRYIDLNEKFLLSEIVTCLKDKKTFITSPVDIWRDYLHPQDLASLIDCCVIHCPMNAVFDAYSNKEVSKFELLNSFVESYGLEYTVDDTFQPQAVTGTKSYYFPTGRRASAVGYAPQVTSLEGIKLEVSAIL